MTMKLTNLLNEEYANTKNQIVSDLHIHENTAFFQEIFLSRSVLGADEISEIKCDKMYQNLFNKTPWTPEDIFLLSDKIKEEEQAFYFYDFGMILSRLINTHHLITENKNYLLKTEHLEKKLPNLCYRNNGANITIYGSVGNGCCKQMYDGIVRILGNCGSLCESMTDGSVSVEGNCNWNVGTDMKNGIVTITGNVANEIGTNMRGGEIIIEGHAFTVGNRMKGGIIRINGNIELSVGWRASYGEIYNKDKRVYPK